MTAAFYNWSGYLVNASPPFLEATATYIQPKVTCTVPNADTVFWVGFDNSTVEQSGTGGVCGGVSGETPAYYAWWEMYPTNSIEVFPITIKPGNKITDTVTFNPATSHYVLAVSDLSNHQQASQAAVCGSGLYCDHDTAEWIVERPTIDGDYAPLADWNKMLLQDALAANSTDGSGNNVLQPIYDFENTNVSMIHDPWNGQYLATASKLSKNGEQFTDLWEAAQ
jgi:hypothetical protein